MEVKSGTSQIHQEAFSGSGRTPMNYIVYCRLGSHPIGSLTECTACQVFRARREAMTKHKEERETPPLVDASMRGLYRDEAFWQFNYPDPGDRLRAQQEYEDWRDPELADLLESTANMPDVRDD
jgi:hypothetical protein